MYTAGVAASDVCFCWIAVTFICYLLMTGGRSPQQARRTRSLIAVAAGRPGQRPCRLQGRGQGRRRQLSAADECGDGTEGCGHRLVGPLCWLGQFISAARLCFVFPKWIVCMCWLSQVLVARNGWMGGVGGWRRFCMVSLYVSEIFWRLWL